MGPQIYGSVDLHPDITIISRGRKKAMVMSRGRMAAKITLKDCSDGTTIPQGHWDRENGKWRTGWQGTSSNVRIDGVVLRRDLAPKWPCSAADDSRNSLWVVGSTLMSWRGWVRPRRLIYRQRHGSFIVVIVRWLLNALYSESFYFDAAVCILTQKIALNTE